MNTRRALERVHSCLPFFCGDDYWNEHSELDGVVEKCELKAVIINVAVDSAAIVAS